MVRTAKLTCIECPTGCALTVSIEDDTVVLIEGQGCRRGRDYAVAEIERPSRILTTTVVANGLSLRVVPVRTRAPIPRERIGDAMAILRKVRLARGVCVGDVVVSDLLGLGVDVVATRDVFEQAVS